MLLRPLLPAALALAGVVLGAMPLRAAPSLQALQEALNSGSSEALTAVLEPGQGLDPDEVARRRLLLREQFPDASWSVQPGPALKDGRSTTQINVTGSREEGPYRFRFEAQQQLVLGLIDSDAPQSLAVHPAPVYESAALLLLLAVLGAAVRAGASKPSSLARRSPILITRSTAASSPRAALGHSA